MPQRRVIRIARKTDYFPARNPRTNVLQYRGKERFIAQILNTAVTEYAYFSSRF